MFVVERFDPSVTAVTTRCHYPVIRYCLWMDVDTNEPRQEAELQGHDHGICGQTTLPYAPGISKLARDYRPRLADLCMDTSNLQRHRARRDPGVSGHSITRDDLRQQRP